MKFIFHYNYYISSRRKNQAGKNLPSLQRNFHEEQEKIHAEALKKNGNGYTYRNPRYRRRLFMEPIIQNKKTLSER